MGNAISTNRAGELFSSQTLSNSTEPSHGSASRTFSPQFVLQTRQRLLAQQDDTYLPQVSIERDNHGYLLAELDRLQQRIELQEQVLARQHRAISALCTQISQSQPSIDPDGARGPADKTLDKISSTSNAQFEALKDLMTEELYALQNSISAMVRPLGEAHAIERRLESIQTSLDTLVQHAVSNGDRAKCTNPRSCAASVTISDWKDNHSLQDHDHMNNNLGIDENVQDRSAASSPKTSEQQADVQHDPVAMHNFFNLSSLSSPFGRCYQDLPLRHVHRLSSEVREAGTNEWRFPKRLQPAKEDSDAVIIETSDIETRDTRPACKRRKTQVATRTSGRQCKPSIRKAMSYMFDESMMSQVERYELPTSSAYLP